MAEIRPVGAGIASLPAAPRGAARADSVRAAQAAFFHSALQEAPLAASGARVKPVAAAGRPVFDPASAPDRILRPGSLVDLKV